MTVAGAMRGDRLPELRTSERELTMRLAFRESDRQSVEDLARLPVMLPDGSRTELGAVADFVVKPSDREIKRLNRLHDRVIDANMAKGTTMDDARKRVEPIMKAYPLPSGLLVEVRPRPRRERQGHPDHGAEHAARRRADLPRHGVAVRIRAVPAVDHHLDRVRDRGLDLVPDADRHDHHDDGDDRLHGPDRRRGEHRHRAHRARDRPARRGLPRHEAILQAGRDRLRPIMMTTLTTLLGLAPLAIGDAQVGGSGEGPGLSTRWRAPSSAASRFSSVVSLLIVPMFYVWFDDLNLWRRRVFSKDSAAGAEPAAPTTLPPAPEPTI